MGMDVYGSKPTATVGEYFRNNVWWWRPLWNYCLVTAPALAGKVSNGHTNDGDGLGARDSKRLAVVLQEQITSGKTAMFAEAYKARLDAMPNEPCQICGGTGKRAEPPKSGPGTVPCNGCDAQGTRRPFDTYYPFSVENVQEFAAFLEHCGGFKIC